MNEEFRPLLPDEHSMLVYAPLAKAIGLNESIFVCQLHYWIENKRISGAEKIEGRYWIYNTFEEWQKQFCFMSVRTLKTVVKKLKDSGIVLTGNYNVKGFDRTTWYTLDYQKLNEVYRASEDSPIVQMLHDGECNSCTMESADVARPIPYTTSYTSSNNSKVNGTSGDVLDSNPSDDYPQDVPDALGSDNHYSPVGADTLSIQSGMATITTNIDRAKISANRLGLDSDTCDEVLKIIKYFLIKYRENRAEHHPVINQDVMDNIVESLTDGMIDTSLELYADVIDDYFRQNLKCDYRLSHFVSGNVRKYRCYETYGNMLNLYDT